MATRLKSRPSYDDDFDAWTQDQAKHLRAQGRLRQNEPLDWKLLAEEVQDWVRVSCTPASHSQIRSSRTF